MPKSPSRTSKKKKYNARFPPARIKKIMQTDEEVGKVAAAVPVIISRALELFIESLISETSKTTIAKNAKTLSTSHIKQTIESHKQFDFLRDLVSSVPDHQTEDNNGDTAAADGEVSSRKGRGRPRKQTDASGRRKRGESSKASSDTSEEEEDEEDDEDTETDDENARVYATATTTTPSSSSTPFDALGDPQSRLIPSSVPSSSTAAPAMFMPNPQTFMPPGVPPSFTNPTMASLQKQQQQLQPYQQFHEKQQQQQQQQQPMSYPSSNMPPYPGTPIPPILMPHQQQGMPNYPLPPQFPNAYQHMMPSSQHVHQQHPSSGHIPEQHQSQPMNLSFSNRAMATTAAENDDYDT